MIGEDEYWRPVAEDGAAWRSIDRPDGGPKPYDGLIIPRLTNLRFAQSSRPNVYRVKGMAQKGGHGFRHVFGPEESSRGVPIATAYALEINKDTFLIERTLNWLNPFYPEDGGPQCVTETEVFGGCRRVVTRLYDYGADIVIGPPEGFR